MSLLFPKRPVGNDPSTIYHQRIWDVIKALESRIAPGLRTSVTTRGVFQEAVVANDSGGGVLEIPEWDDSGYSEGDFVRRTAGNSGTGPFTDAEGRDAAGDGRRLGIWRALESIAEGSGDAPSLDSEVWEFIGGLATEYLTLQKDSTGAIELNVRDGTAPVLQLTKAGSLDEINLDLTLTAGKVLQPREVDVCVNGVRKRMLVIASEPYAI